jgi:hypothetical protein
MRSYFEIDFLRKKPSTTSGWVVLLAGSALLALGTHTLTKTRDELSALENRATRKEQQYARTGSTGRDSPPEAVSQLIEPELSYPWAGVLQSLEVIRGSRLRVLSFEHEMARRATSVVVEVSDASELAAIDDLARATRGWATESIASSKKGLRLRLRRSTETDQGLEKH